MSSKAEPFYLKFSTRPSISKQNIQKLDLKKWESSLKDFNEDKKVKKFSSLESNALYKELINKKIPEKRFFKNVHKSLKRKSISEKNITESEFLCLSSQSSSHQSIKKGKNTIRNFKIHAIQALFENKTLGVKCDSKPKFEQIQYDHKSMKRNSVSETKNTEFSYLSIPLFSFVQSPQDEERTSQSNISNRDKKSVIHTDLQNSDAVFKKDIKKPIPKQNFITPKEFSHVHSEYFLNISSIGNDGFKISESATKVKHDNIGSLFKSDAVLSGSDWVHSLDQIHEDHSQCEGKKKIQNLLIGGYCEQILKFQRRELSEKTICEHRNVLKTTSESVLLRINSIIHDYEIVVAKCCLLDRGTHPKELSGDVLNEGLTYTALFQKSSFYKEQMKTGKSFILSPPWHLIQLKSFTCPVIICKYFTTVSNELIQCEKTMQLKQCNPVIERECYKNKIKKVLNSELKEDMFFMWQKRVNICARIQRIWNVRIPVTSLLDLTKDQNIHRVTLLLQARNGDFYLLSTFHHYLSTIDWFKCVQSDEGHFYFFENLNVLLRLEQRRYPKLFKYLQNLLKEDKVTGVKQHFVYQLSIDGMTKKPKMIEADLPPFLPFNFQPLSTLIENSGSRASFKAKVLVQYGSILYVSDESIFYSRSRKYVKVFLPESSASFSNFGIYITETLIFEGNLYLDEYSRISYLHSSNLSTLIIQDAELSLSPHSNVTDIVTVKGNITDVDENNACIWLQCNFCMNENLAQNSEDVIFCEDCCLVVSRPLLQVTVTVADESLQDILLNIESCGSKSE